MRFANGKLQFFLILLCVFLIVICDAGKDNKHKHDKHKSKHETTTSRNDQQHHKNSTSGQHQNNSSAHNSSAGHALHDSNPPPIGWSLHSNPNQPPPAGNPHGYAVQHHSPDQSHSPPNSGHQGHQPQHQPQAPASQDSGPSALGTGLGGLALGAIGGAAGGYLLSNALNSGGKSEEKTSETVTSTITETTLTSLPSSVVEANESSTTVISNVSVDAENTTDTTLIVAPQNVPIETVSSSEQPLTEGTKSEQKLTEAEVTSVENAKTTNGGAVIKIYFNIFSLSVVSSLLIFMRA